MRGIDVAVAAVLVGGLLAALTAWRYASRPNSSPTAQALAPPLESAPPAPTVPNPAKAPATEPPPSLSQLRQWCVDSVRGGTPPAGYANACDQFAARSRQSLPPAAPKGLVSTPRRAEPAPRPPVKTRPRPAVIVNECEHQRYGSIAYRQCRKDEWKRLKTWCFNLNERANVEKGQALKEVMLWRTPVCLAYERYQIVK